MNCLKSFNCLKLFILILVFFYRNQPTTAHHEYRLSLNDFLSNDSTNSPDTFKLDEAGLTKQTKYSEVSERNRPILKHDQQPNDSFSNDSALTDGEQGKNYNNNKLRPYDDLITMLLEEEREDSTEETIEIEPKLTGTDPIDDIILNHPTDIFAKTIDIIADKQVVLFFESYDGSSPASSWLSLSGNTVLFPSDETKTNFLPKCVRDEFNETVYYCQVPHTTINSEEDEQTSDEEDEPKSNVVHDILSTYYLNRLVTKAHSLKVVLVIHRDAISISKELKTLINKTAKHIKNISKFSNAIALVVTGYDDVENHENYENKISELENFLQQIANEIPIDPVSKEFLQALLESNRKIALSSPMNNRVLMTSLTRVSSLIHENISYVIKPGPSDVDFPLTEMSMVHISGLVITLEQVLNDNITSFDSIVSYFFSREFSDSSDIGDIVRFTRFFEELSEINVNTSIYRPSTVVNLINEKLLNLNVTLDYNRALLDSISNSDDLLHFLKSYDTYRKSRISLTADKLLNKFQGGFMKILSEIIDFLKISNQIFKCSSSYVVQYQIRQNGFPTCSQDQQSMFDCLIGILNKLQENATVSCKAKFKTGSTFLNQLKHDLSNKSVNEMTVNQKLTELFNYLFKKSKPVPNEIKKKLVFKNSFVFLSDIEPYLKNIVKVEIFALEKVFIDTLVVYESKEDVQFSIVAPVWEIACDSYYQTNVGIDLFGAPAEKIIPEKANDGETGEKRLGHGGKNGNQGYSGGSIFGVADTILEKNCGNLVIKSTGGRGGKGQDGGDGGKGVEKIDEIDKVEKKDDKWIPPDSNACKLPPFPTYESSSNLLYECKYKIPCGIGGNGGPGGSGGRGGPGGRISILLTSGESFLGSSNEGPGGAKGKGGSGGVGGRSYWTHYTIITGILDFLLGETRNNIKNDPSNCNYGEAGVDGSDYSSELSVTNFNNRQNFLTRPGKIINSFKRYARSVKNNLRESHLSEFLSKIDNDEKIIQIVNSANYIAEEFMALNSQFQKELSRRKDERTKVHRIYLLRYSDLLNRTENYANSLKIEERENSEDEHKVINYLRVAILGEICRLHRQSGGYLFVNLAKSLDNARTNIEAIKEEQWRKVADKSFNTYKKSFERKIWEAQDLISGRVNTDLDRILDETDLEIRTLLHLVSEKRDNALNVLHERDFNRKSLEKSIITKGLLTTLTVVSQFMMILGPFGSMAGALTTGAVSLTDAALDVKNPSNPNIKLDPFPVYFNSSLNKLKSELDHSRLKLPDSLENAKQKAKFFDELQDFPNNISQSIDEFKININQEENDIKKKHEKEFSQIKHNLENVEELEKDMDEIPFTKNSQIVNYRKKKQDLKKIQKNMSKDMLPDETLSKKVEYLKRFKHKWDSFIDDTKKKVSNLKIDTSKVTMYMSKLKTIASLVDVSEFNKLRAAYETATESLHDAEFQIQKIDKFEVDVRTILVKSFERLQEHSQELSTDSKGKSHAVYLVMKSEMKRSIYDFKNQVEQMTRTFPNEFTFKNCVNKLEEVIKVMIDLLDQIQKYEDEVNLAAFINSVAKPSDPATMDLSDEKLIKLVNNLQSNIHNNLIIQQYEEAFDAFKQYAFPFVDFYLTEFEDPWFTIKNYQNKSTSRLVNSAISKFEDTSLKTENDQDKSPELVSNAILKIKAMSRMLKEDEAYAGTVVDRSTSMVTQFDGSATDKPIFYAWEYVEIRRLMHGFFNFRDIVLNADVSRSPNFLDAIRFNTFDLRFVFSNETIQRKFDHAIKNFKLVSQHFGNNYYRCGKHFYHIVTQPQEFDFTFEKNRKGEPVTTYVFFENLQKNLALLSPYCTWRFRIDRRINNDVNPLILNKFVNQKVRLELVGTGRFVDGQKSNVCDNVEKLSAFYRRV